MRPLISTVTHDLHLSLLLLTIVIYSQPKIGLNWHYFLAENTYNVLTTLRRDAKLPIIAEPIYSRATAVGQQATGFEWPFSH
jgi:hypothetical protein